MRHGDKINNLGRTTAHRKALLSNLACQLIEHKRIFTTLAKAKSLRTYVEPMITRSKVDNTHNRRLVFSHLQDKDAVTELFSVVSDKVANRPGGYTRIIKTQARMGDAADMAMIELVDFNTLYVKDAKDGAKKTRRSRRGGSAKPAAAPVEASVAAENQDTAPTVEADVADVADVAHEADTDATPAADTDVTPAADDLNKVEGAEEN